MKLNDFYNTKQFKKLDDIEKYRTEIDYEETHKSVIKSNTQQIMDLFDTDSQTANELLDREARIARKRTKELKKEKQQHQANAERERILQLVQSITDLSDYAESEAQVDALVQQYIRKKK